MATAVYRWAFAPAIAAAILVWIAPSASASLIGHTISAKELAPDTATVQDDLGTATVGPGVEFVFDLTLNLDFGASTMTISVEPNSIVGFFDAPFNGFGFVDLTAPFGSASIDPTTSVAGFTAANLTLSGGELFMNLQSLAIDGPSDGFPGTEIVIDIFVAVPEPSSVALFGAGLAALALFGLLIPTSLRV